MSRLMLFIVRASYYMLGWAFAGTISLLFSPNPTLARIDIYICSGYFIAYVLSRYFLGRRPNKYIATAAAKDFYRNLVIFRKYFSDYLPQIKNFDHAANLLSDAVIAWYASGCPKLEKKSLDPTTYILLRAYIRTRGF